MFAAFSAALLIIKWITLRCKSFLNDQSLYGENLNEMHSSILELAGINVKRT